MLFRLKKTTQRLEDLNNLKSIGNKSKKKFRNWGNHERINPREPYTNKTTNLNNTKYVTVCYDIFIPILSYICNKKLNAHCKL